MNVYQLPAREPDREKEEPQASCLVMGQTLFKRRFLDILDARLRRVEDHAHALAEGQTPHFLIAAIQQEAQSIAATAVSAGWLTLALLARDTDRMAQVLWSQPVTVRSAQTLLPGLHKLLHEGMHAVRSV